jgi:tetratricopeptide (TPR) repeat protein
LLEHQRAKAAASLLEEGVAKAPSSADLYLLLSVAQALTESTQLAQAAVQKAISLNPTLPLAYDVLGFCYFRIGDYLRAADTYRLGSDLSPQTGRFAYDTALAYERGNQPQKAIVYAERAAEDDPKQAVNHYLLGKLYGKLERKTESVRELETAVQLDPSLDYPYYLLARMYMRTGNLAKAQELNRKFEELKKQQVRMHGVSAMVSEPEAQAPPSMLLGAGQMDPEPSLARGH